jgi:hypothetical protein
MVQTRSSVRQDALEDAPAPAAARSPAGTDRAAAASPRRQRRTSGSSSKAAQQHHEQPEQQPSTGGRRHAADTDADAAAAAAAAAAAKDKLFHKGVAISMWQNSGDDDSNWTNFIKSKFPFAALPVGTARYSGKYSVLQACPDTWNRCEVRARARARWCSMER